MPTIILITGYARSGKDTFRNGLFLSGKNTVLLRNFADSLKEACDDFLYNLGLDCKDEKARSFFNERFKVEHRNALVSFGKFARSLDQDVFANKLTDMVNVFTNDSAVTVVVADWRYVNELLVVRKNLPDWRVITIRINTSGLNPANEEEGLSIGQITREVPIDYEYTFAPQSFDFIVSEGKKLAKQLQL